MSSVPPVHGVPSAFQPFSFNSPSQAANLLRGVTPAAPTAPVSLSSAPGPPAPLLIDLAPLGMSAENGALAVRYSAPISHTAAFTLSASATHPKGWGGSWTAELKRFEGSEVERPESFVLSWSGAQNLDVELFAVELTCSVNSKRLTWRYPLQRALNAADGKVEFRGLIPSARWKSATLRPTSICFYVRERMAEVPKQVVVGDPAQLLDNYSRNDVAFVFPSVKQILWANSADLAKSSDYFALMFSADGFAEVEEKLDAPELEEKLLKAASSSGSKADSTAAKSSEVVKAKAKDVASSASTAPPAAGQVDEQALEDSDEEDAASAVPTPRSPSSIHRIIVREASYKTYRAMLYYLACGKISFAHLSSLYPSSRRPPSSRSASTSNLGPPVSPKSMYRLADFLSLRDLRGLAFASLESQLCANNCLAELLSDLVADYDDVREACIAAVLRHWPALVEAGEIEELGRKVVEGELEPRKARIAWDVMSRLKPAA